MEIPEAPYNYCDYRCEKCPWTEHCAIYQQEQADRLLLQADEIDPDSWEGTLELVRRNFEKAHKMLEEDAEKMGIDLSDPLEPVPEPPETELEQRAHECALRLHQLSKRIASSEEFSRWQEILDEAYQDLLWNQTLFAVKLRRAMHGLWDYENEDDDDLRDVDFSDGMKSAEVSVRAMESNREALAILAEKISPLAGEIRQEIRELEQIQSALEAELRKYRGEGSS
ncbi:hypothetical protein GWN26_05415 [Candidatus Saccharibacteria bacterium]|nr:hypothetical protein [Calditrichia bacterium]NIV98602.1 hypothetical protein [Candidatus Saccharibacteria bacterium]NIW78854.1 hypothetical protein [Calditrichia bacterium]